MEQEHLFDLGPDWAGFDKDIRSLIGRSEPPQEQAPKSFSVAGAVPDRVVCPGSVTEACEVVQAIKRRGLCAVPLGLCAHAAAAGAPDRPFVALSTRRLVQAVDFQPSNMTLTIQSGATLEALQTVAAKAEQWLPLDPPLESQTTVGGLIAADLSGPARFSQGTVRDLLIGLKVVNADGTIVSGGGRVVKNVAGYDLPKLFVGSEGTLGLIVEATFKLRPRPSSGRLLRMRCDDRVKTQEILRRILMSGLEPFLLELLSFVPLGEIGYNVVVGFYGSEEQVSYQVEQTRTMLEHEGPLEELTAQEASAALQELRDFRASGRTAVRLRANLLPTQIVSFVRQVENEGGKSMHRIAVQAHAGNGIVHVRIRTGPGESGASEALAQMIQRLRSFAQDSGGSLIVVEAPRELRERVSPWGSALSGLALMHRVKGALDSGNIFSPGRFLPQTQKSSRP